MIPSIPKNILLYFTFGLYSISGIAQDNSNSDLIEIGNQWQVTLSELNKEIIRLPERYVSNKHVLSAGKKINKEIEIILNKIDQDPTNQDLFNQLFLNNTNASLWYSQITTDDYQVFLRRLVTGRPIKKEVVEDIKLVFAKWIKTAKLKNLNRYSQILHDTGKSYEILTKLTVSTNYKEGVSVKYRSITDNDSEILDSSLERKLIPVGNYYVWLEKDGSVISDNTIGYSCITSTKKIVLSSR
jgi:hypothetical protein